MLPASGLAPPSPQRAHKGAPCASTTEPHCRCQLFQDPKQCQLVQAQLRLTRHTMYRYARGREITLSHEIRWNNFWLNCHFKQAISGAAVGHYYLLLE